MRSMRISIPYRWQRRLELAFGILCLLAFVILSSLAVFLHIQHQKPAFDLIIGNGNVFDGQHFLGLGSDVGVRSGKVVEIGFLFGVPAKERINAWRLIVAPGFIDTHVHVEQNMRSKRPMGAGNYVKMA